MEDQATLPLLLQEALGRWAADPARVAFEDPSGELTFADLVRLGTELALGIRGVEAWRGRPVAYLGRQRNEFHLLFMAAAYAGVPLAGLNWRLAPPELREVLADARPGLLVVEPEYRALADAAAGADPDLLVVETWGVAALADALPDPPAGTALPEVRPDDCLLLVYTSGTTGRPKGVMLSHRNVLLSAEAFARVALVDGDSRVLVQAPTFHVAGNVFGVQGPLQGGLSYLVATSDAADLVRTVREQRLTHVNLVPTLLRSVLDAERAAPGSLDSMRCVVYGAAPIDPPLLAEATGLLSCGFAQSFGLSETVGVVAMLAPADHDPARPELLASVGRPLRWTETRVVDPGTGEDVPPGTVGELWARGPRVMLGYWRAPEATAAAFSADGWLRTGDLVAERGGYLFLAGRLKDMIVSGGENVYAVEVENALLAHPDVVEAAVVGRAHPRWGEVPVGHVVLRAGAEVSGEDLRGHCRGLLAGYKVPADVVVTGALPRNAMGKVVKAGLRG